MAYIDCSNINLNEISNIKTISHNLWTRLSIGGSHSGNGKQKTFLTSLAFLNIPLAATKFLANNVFGVTDYIDQKFFHSMYTIKPELKNKLLKWVSNIDGAYLVTDNINNASRTKLDFKRKDNLAIENTGKSTSKGSIKNKLSTATAFYKLREGNKYYILYFTFNDNKILNAKVLCNRNNNFNNANNNSFYVKPIKEFNTVNKIEYTKEN